MVHLQGSFQQAPFRVRCVCVGGVFRVCWDQSVDVIRIP